ncbi:hypothetical protein Pmani_038152 [Petrolisthes manimaculis]|uniref:Uncharacterized protein n=1 Tax=Petrolisthes manimaculis TaxID=1843537 RepID=A0AAE1TKT4_9EUCA|nr:hypothetical protein Pmani_038152 [Petrolisthes manimaculis]
MNVATSPTSDRRPSHSNGHVVCHRNLEALTFHVKAAQCRYSGYFLGPPRASTPTRELMSRTPEPDEAQQAAQRRYMSYFNAGPPPRPRSTISPAPDFSSYRQNNVTRPTSMLALPVPTIPPHPPHPPHPPRTSCSLTHSRWKLSDDTWHISMLDHPDPSVAPPP